MSFDDACKKMEQVSLRDEEDIKRAYMQSQVIFRLPFILLPSQRALIPIVAVAQDKRLPGADQGGL